MSIKVMTAVWENSSHSGSNLLLMLALADWAGNDGGRIYPSVDAMCLRTRLSERGVRYILRKLEASGELVREGRGPKGTYRYRIALDGLKGAKIAPADEQGGQNHAAGGQSDASEGAIGCPRSVIDPSIDPSVIYISKVHPVGGMGRPGERRVTPSGRILVADEEGVFRRAPA